MIGFAAIAVAMTVAALACVVLPLARRRRQADAPAQSQTNLEILRDQLAELDADLARGAISSGHFEVSRSELERRVLEETAASAQPGQAGRTGGRRAAIALAVIIPLAALSIYVWIGEPAGLRNEAVSGEQPTTTADVEDMVTRLAERLRKNPDDAKGWALLGRSYYVMQRMDDAVAAYEKAAARIPDDADLYADYADALAMSQGRNLRGKPMELVNRALAINPAQPKALAMAGTEAFDRKDYPKAIEFWEKLLAMLPADSEISKSIAGGIAEARELGGVKPSKKSVPGDKPGAAPTGQSAPAGNISGTVSLSPAVAAKASPGETVFIVARAVNGPRIPLAVLRKRVADLPLDFRLDDTLAMSPELKLSSVHEVVVTARVSKTGNAISQSGDLQGASPPVKVGSGGLKIVIDSVVP